MKSDTSSFRRKNFQEAADTGILLWRENFIYFLPLFAIPLWVCAFASRIILPDNFQIYSWLIIWFLKPLFDRIIVHIISIRFFERDANLKRLSNGLWKTLLRGLIGDLSWRRFSPLRSAMMPMRVLEKNLKPGKLTSMRKKHLKNGGLDYGFLLTIWGIAVEITLLLGQYLFFLTINELMLNGKIGIFNFSEIEIYLFAAWCFNFILIETIYVCMGFSLYINSRIAVEGWDLEIIFKNFAEKIREKAKKAVLIILFAFCLFAPSVSHAEETVPYEELKNILASPDFGGEKESWGIRLKHEYKKTERVDSENMESIQKVLEIISEFFSNGFKIILIFIIAALIFFIIFYLRKVNWNLKNIKWNKAKNLNSSASSALKNETAEDPKILLEKALNYYKLGDIRLAWGYCTAAAIQSWQTYRKIIFPPNATESDCSIIVNQKAADKAEAGAFYKLINNWVYFAYAGKNPAEGDFNEAVNFCVLLRSENG